MTLEEIFNNEVMDKQDARQIQNQNPPCPYKKSSKYAKRSKCVNCNDTFKLSCDKYAIYLETVAQKWRNHYEDMAKKEKK